MYFMSVAHLDKADQEDIDHLTAGVLINLNPWKWLNSPRRPACREGSFIPHLGFQKVGRGLQSCWESVQMKVSPGTLALT